MVFFTCGHCGDSIQKPKVTKHYQFVCRNFPQLTCVDCLKDFAGNEYESHNKCFTEDQRYSAGGLSGGVTMKKGEKKQEQWQTTVQNILDTRDLKPEERTFLSLLSSQPNLPRKKTKFINFLNSAYRQYARNTGLVESVWNILDTEIKRIANENILKHQNKNQESEKNGEGNRKLKEGKNQENLEETNGIHGNNESGDNKESKKRKKEDPKRGKKNVKLEDINEVHNNNEPNSCETKKKKKKSEVEENNEPEEILNSFNWVDTINKLIQKKAKDNEVSLEKIQKKAVKKYCKATQKEMNPKIVKKFLQKLKKIPNITIKNNVLIVIS